MTIIDALERYAPLSEACKTALLERTEVQTIAANTVLLCPGQTSDKIYFIESGVARVYYYADADADADADKSITSWFAQAGGLLSSIESFFSQGSADEYIETLEKCRCRILTYKALEQLYVEFPELNIVFRKQNEFYLCVYERRNKLMRTQNLIERYEYFMELYPNLPNHVKCKYIASYLGMKPETLSRTKRAIYELEHTGKKPPKKAIS